MKKLYRSEDNKVFAGVIGGLGDYFTIDPVLIRVLVIFIAIITGIIPMVLVYLLSIFVVPTRSEVKAEYTDPKEPEGNH